MNNWSVILLSFCIAAGGAWFMSRFAYCIGLIDMPNDRSSHALPTPRGGGVGVLVAFTFAAIVLSAPLYLWLPAGLLSALSFLDDRLDLSPRTRLAFQFTAALAVVWPVGSSLPVTPLAQMLCVVLLTVFLVGTANFYNFMDGINGIAGLTGATAFTLLAVFTAFKGLGSETQQLLALAAACLGFLPFNIPAARVFMGDVGSVLLGFVFASYILILAHSPGEFLAFAGCLFPFYADALSTLFTRWRAGEKLSQAHRRHLYQLMVNQLKIPHWKVAAGYAVVQAAMGIVCITLANRAALLTFFLGGSFLVWCCCVLYIRNKWEIIQSS